MISTYSSQRAEALISSGPVPTWTNAHTYSVRKEVPFVSHLDLQHLLQGINNYIVKLQSR